MPKKSTSGHKEWPIVRHHTYRNGEKAWMVDTRLQGKGARVFKATEAEAKEVARLARIQRSMNGTAYFGMDTAQRADAERALVLISPYGMTLTEAVQFCIPLLDAKRQSRTVKDCSLAYRDNAAARKLSLRHQRDLRLRLDRFCDTFGNRLMTDVRVDEIDAWLVGLKVKGITMNGYRQKLVALFTYAQSHGWCRENPAAKSTLVQTVSAPVGILSLSEATTLLNSANSEILPGLAIGAFAGLRAAEITRLEWRHVDLEENLIEVTAANAKSSKRRLVTIPPNLALWLRPLVQKKGFVWPQSEMRARRLTGLAQTAAGFDSSHPWPANALRHSYASYHLAHHRDAAHLALELGHADTELIFAHYRKVVRPAVAEKYWQILPQQSLKC